MFGQQMSHELEVQYPSAFSIEGCVMNTTGSPGLSFHLSEPGKWNPVDMAYQYRRAPTPLLIQNISPNICPQPQAVPAMIMEGSSTRSSPVSPYTPGRDSNHEVQDHDGHNFVNDTVSPQEAALPGAGMYVADGYNFHGWHGYPPTSNVPRPDGLVPLETYSSSPITRICPREIADFPLAPESYQEHTQEPVPSQGSSANLQEPHNYWDDPRLGTFESDGSMWYRQRTHGERVEETRDESRLLDQQIFNELQQARGHGDNNQHQSLPQKSLATATQAASYPPVACGDCGKEFTGRYRNGNRKRHIDTIHNVLKSMAGKTCRVCPQTFKRRDAKRKHEWNKHHLFDARPTTRQPK